MKFRTLASSRNRTARRAAVARVESWTRSRFGLPREMAVSVSQIECTVPGCPPVETVVMFWTGPQGRHQFKVFKPLDQVQPDDLPPAWMKDALAATDGIDCGCC